MPILLYKISIKDKALASSQHYSSIYLTIYKVHHWVETDALKSTTKVLLMMSNNHFSKAQGRKKKQCLCSVQQCPLLFRSPFRREKRKNSEGNYLKTGPTNSHKGGRRTKVYPLFKEVTAWEITSSRKTSAYQ